MLEEMTKGLWTAWQPIYHLRSGTVWGHEALVRGPQGQPFETPESLFELARREGAEEQFEQACRFLAFRSAARDLVQSSMLFVNANPIFLTMPIAPPDQPWSSARTVIEISESSPFFESPETLQSVVAHWRAQGYRIALDDFGTGYAGEAAILAIRPDIVKIDQRFVRGIHGEPWRKEIVSAMQHMCSDLGVAVVAEGIETPEDLSELMTLGVTLGQGFLLGRPAREPAGRHLLGELGMRMEQGETPLRPPEGSPSYVVDRGRRILSWNAAAEKATGFRAEVVTGLTCWLSGLDHRSAAGQRLCFHACPLVTAMQTGSVQSAVVSMQTQSGTRQWVQVRAEPIFGEGSEPIGAMETFIPAEGAPLEAAAASLEPSVFSALAAPPAADGPPVSAAHHLFWRKEIARWLARWQGSSEGFGKMASRFVQSLPFRVVGIWQPQADGNRCIAIAHKGYGGGPQHLSVPLNPPQSLAAQAYLRHDTMRWPGPHSDPQIRMRADVAVAAAIPLMHAGDVKGILTIGDDSATRLPDAAIAAIEEVAPLLGAMMANHELLASLQRGEEIFRWMLASAPIALDYLPYQEQEGISVPSTAAFRAFRRSWDKIAGVRGGILLMLEEVEERWTVHDVWGAFALRSLGVRDRWIAAAKARLAQDGDNLREGEWLAPDHPLRLGGLPNYMHPIRDGHQLIALLLVAVASADHEKELFPLLQFTSLATVNRHRQRELMRVARQDPLTGALNRRALEERLEAYLKGRTRRPALFLLVDLDNLKTVNDSQGHQAADLLLRRFTSHARSVLRPQDEVARIGGDEFVWVLYDAQWDEATRLRLGQVLADSPLFEYGSGATIGAVELPREAHSYAEAYRLADRRLYLGKEAGRGVIIGSEELSDPHPESP